MKNLLYDNAKFDDYVVGDDEHVWSQVCEQCVAKCDFKRSELDECGSGICGVEGCSNDSSFYIDFNDAKIKYE